MPLAHAMWVHGHSLRVEYPDRLAESRRHGSAITLVGNAGSTNWLHLGIPTPVIVDGKRLDLDSVMLRFRTSGASVTRVHIYDGETRLAAHDGLDKHPAAYGLERFAVPGSPHARWGVGVSFRVEFAGAGTQRRIEVSSAGADFV